VDKNVEKKFKPVAKRRIKSKSVYSSKREDGLFTKDLLITSSIDLFTINPVKMVVKTNNVKSADYFRNKYKVS
jgi:hypothetical protein